LRFFEVSFRKRRPTESKPRKGWLTYGQLPVAHDEGAHGPEAESLRAYHGLCCDVRGWRGCHTVSEFKVAMGEVRKYEKECIGRGEAR
jgi:hypothetical protein